MKHSSHRNVPEHAAMMRLAVKALEHDGELAIFRDGTPSRTVHWDIAGKCHKPVTVELAPRGATDRHGKFTWICVILRVKCRKCERCRMEKSWDWRNRAEQEFKDAELIGGRTWMCTYTFRPESWYSVLNTARIEEKARGSDFDALPEDRKIAALDRECGLLFRTYWADVNSAVKHRTGLFRAYRYLTIAEQHRSGVLHYHALVHEAQPCVPILRRDLDRWRHGFTKFAPVKSVGGAHYVAKYLTKDVGSRIRASKNYGRPLAIDYGGYKSPNTPINVKPGPPEKHDTSSGPVLIGQESEVV